MRPWGFHSAGSLRFGRGVAGSVGEAARELRGRRAVVITDATLAGLGFAEPLEIALRFAGLSVLTFAGGRPEPTDIVVAEAVAAARPFAPDVVVGLGGGSNLDVAKLVAACLAHDAPASAFVGEFRVPGPVLPLIACPTTAGTGSEVSPAAVFTETARRVKVSCLSPFLRPAVALVDPAFTDGCPRTVTADSGMDALTHAIEAYTAVDNDDFPLPPGERSIYQGKNPLADAAASEAITLVGRFLRRAASGTPDPEARDGMALAGTLGGLAFSNAGVALVHAMEYPVGGAVHVSHGAGNALLLPHVMRYNLPTRIREFRDIALLLGVADVDASAAANAVRAIDAVESLLRDLGMPTRLRDLGVTEAMLPAFAEQAFAVKRLLRVNPRPPASPGDLLQLYRAAY